LGPVFVATILQNESSNLNETQLLNLTEYDYANSCGINNCPQTLLPPSQSKPTKNSVYALYGTLIGMIALSILVTLFFVDDLSDESKAKEKPKFSDTGKL
jgi:hypothetical protein